MPRKLPPVPPREALKLHRSLSIEKLLKIIQRKVKKIPEYRLDTLTHTMLDVVMSAFAVFALKYPSLLQFDNNKHKRRIRHNLRTLFGILKAPCDTTLREVCDEIDPYLLRPAFTEIIKTVHSEGALEAHGFLGGHLLSMDATGHFSSSKVSCPHCCKKHHRNGKVTYYHQLMGAAIVHPDKAQVFPLFPEAITKQDGATKNDCESNAAKRLLPAIHDALPNLKFIVLQDAIGADAPNIRMIQAQGYSYIITVTADDQVSLYNLVQERICQCCNGCHYKLSEKQLSVRTQSGVLGG